MEADLLLEHFPELTARQIEQFNQLGPLYREWNAKINVISRKDIDNLYVNHVLHSLAIAKVVTFKPGAKVLDLGTGGGFPGIPLAILFPETEFYLVDSIRKKITVCNEVITAAGINNARAEQRRVEEIKQGGYDFIVTRAVARMEKLVGWSKHLIGRKQQHAIPNGWLALKGRGLEEEMASLPKGSYLEEHPVEELLPGHEFYGVKAVIYLQR